METSTGKSAIKVQEKLKEKKNQKIIGFHHLRKSNLNSAHQVRLYFFKKSKILNSM